MDFKTGLSIFQVILCIFLIAIVLLQSGASKNMSALSGGSSDTFYGKSKSRPLDSILNNLTTIAALCFVVVVMMLNAI